LTTGVALVTARGARGLDEDMPPLSAALAAAGAHSSIVDWDDRTVDWARFDLVVLRSAWDYAERLPEFLAWAEGVARVTTLVNPLPVVRWNTDKHYLGELARAGAPVVPTTYLEPGADAARALEEFLAHEPCRELVVKPAVGAGARDARRHLSGARAEILGHVAPLLAARRAVMLQPYLASVDAAGETALMYLDGRFSHAIRKGALLPAGAPSTAALFAAEDIVPRTPAADELAAAERILAAVPAGGRLAYARVDLLRDAQGIPRLLELELTEPSFFLTHAPGAAERFAAVLLARLAASRRA
jgi:glutathione synthase/RimK-type ligase-like ATP-grasp enzyme